MRSLRKCELGGPCPTAAVPCAWSPGDSLASTCSPDVEVVAAGSLAKCEAVDEADLARKRRKTTVDPVVKDWFLDNHEGMKVKHKWNIMQSWRRAQEMLPSLLKDVHESGLYRWTHCDHKTKNKDRRGREYKLNVAHLTMPGQVCNNLAWQVALTSCTYQKIFAAGLKEQGVDWTPSIRWVRRFLGARWPQLQETWRRCREGAWAWSVC